MAVDARSATIKRYRPAATTVQYSLCVRQPLVGRKEFESLARLTQPNTTVERMLVGWLDCVGRAA